MPTVKAGMRMCHPISQANWKRDRRTGSRSMTTSLEPSQDIVRHEEPIGMRSYSTSRPE
jgi:hypothetical protein